MSELNNPAEPVPDVATAAEAGQPVEPDVETIFLAPEEGTSASGSNQNNEIVDESITRHTRLLVRFADESKAEDSSEGESLLEINKALQFYKTPHPSIPFFESFSNEEPIQRKFVDKFTQTFFKYMKNLSDRRFMEIIRQKIEPDDKSLVFYCSSSKLLLTFQS